jgi:predicted enzyme related to lactoylglutathione lyase
MGNRIAYFEVGSSDFETLVGFYRELFGWRLQAAGDGYALIDTRAGGGVNGGIGRSRTGDPWVAFYVAVEDPQALLDRAAALGGATAVPVTEVPGVVTFAMLDDPDGNLVGVVKADAPPAQGPSAGDGVAVDWFEVLGADAERTQRFYCELFGWTLQGSGSPGYGLVDTQAGEDAIGGGLGAGEGATWATVYANVPDVEAALARAEALGGGRVHGPNQVDDHTRTGALRDPAGNVFGVYEHHH